MQTQFAQEDIVDGVPTGAYILNGEKIPRGKLPPGTLYYQKVYWYDGVQFDCSHEPVCERHLHAVCPNGRHWNIDSRASNCTLPSDKIHHCWVRHGDPEKGEPVHVDKNGNTCAAGAGSIIVGDYHGFLHNGQFTGNL